MGHEEPGSQGQGDEVMTNLDYKYGGQWFDDMGSLALFFTDSPSTGIDIARAGLTRDQANDMAQQLANSGISAYDDETVPDLGV